MNSLEYAGKGMLYYPFAGHEFYFERLDRNHVTLKDVQTVDESVTQRWDETAQYDDLPKPVKNALADENLEFRTRVESITEAM